MPEPDRKLVLHVPEQEPKDIPLDRKEFVIGRDPDVDIPVNDRRVSRNHARIARTETGYTLCDLGSRNGTYINDEKIGAEDGEVPLGQGDRIRLGSHIIQCVMPGIPSKRQGSAATDQDKTEIAGNMRDYLIEPPKPGREDREDGAPPEEWPPMPEEESPGDEIDTGGISALNLSGPSEGTGSSQSIELDLRDAEIEAIRAEEEEEAGLRSAREAEEAAAAPAVPEDEDGTVAETVTPRRRASAVGSSIPKVKPDTGYDISVDIEDLREANARFILYGEDVSESVPVNRRKVTVGRGRHNDIVVDHHTVSSVHAEIQFSGDGFELIDKNSTNGTYVENARVRERDLVDGSYVLFGGIMSLFFHDLEGGEKREKANRIGDALVRGGALPKARLREAQEQARSSGLRLAEQLILERDVTPGQWWEASRMAGFGGPAERQVSMVVPLAIIATIVLVLLFVLYVFLVQ